MGAKIETGEREKKAESGDPWENGKTVGTTTAPKTKTPPSTPEPTTTIMASLEPPPPSHSWLDVSGHWFVK